MKRWMIGLVCVLCLLLCACQDSSENTTQAPPELFDASEAAVILPEEALIYISVEDASLEETKDAIEEMKSLMYAEGFLAEQIVFVEHGGEEAVKTAQMEAAKEKGADLILAKTWKKGESEKILEEIFRQLNGEVPYSQVLE